MFRNKTRFIACPDCGGPLKEKRNGSYKCRLCKCRYTHEEYIEKNAKQLFQLIDHSNDLVYARYRMDVLRKYIKDRDDRLYS